MLRLLKLLLPALIPSWNFFDIITPSPRVQYALLNTENETASVWYEFRPRPQHVSFPTMLGRMLWNPAWNESMYIISCAERILEQPTQHSEDEILNYIIKDLSNKPATNEQVPTDFIQFRLLVVERDGAALQQVVTFYSRIQKLAKKDKG